ncbi:MAG: transcriptional regulator Spx, partial [Solobacterium sp.]|nr:transcriptional regulator Spx [Solobacterium sp.]
YDEEEIGVFVPVELRRLADHSCNESCPNFKACQTMQTAFQKEAH